MNLKKIQSLLQQNLIENGFTDANEIQETSFSALKSGADCLLIAPEGAGKTTTIVINVLQKLVGSSEESPRALLIVATKEKVIEMVSLFNILAKNSGLEIYGVHDKGDMDYDKNYISTGIDVLIGTPQKLSDMFSTAGYNVNRLKMFVLDDADTILRLRHETRILRLSDSIAKTQRIIFSDTYTERVAILADKMLLEPIEFDFDIEEDEEINDDFTAEIK